MISSGDLALSGMTHPWNSLKVELVRISSSQENARMITKVLLPLCYRA